MTIAKDVELILLCDKFSRKQLHIFGRFLNRLVRHQALQRNGIDAVEHLYFGERMAKYVDACLLYTYAFEIAVYSLIDRAAGQLIAEAVEENIVSTVQMVVFDMLPQNIKQRIGKRYGVVAPIFRVVELHDFGGKVYVFDPCCSDSFGSYACRKQEHAQHAIAICHIKTLNYALDIAYQKRLFYRLRHADHVRFDVVTYANTTGSHKVHELIDHFQPVHNGLVAYPRAHEMNCIFVKPEL